MYKLFVIYEGSKKAYRVRVSQRDNREGEFYIKVYKKPEKVVLGHDSCAIRAIANALSISFDETMGLLYAEAKRSYEQLNDSNVVRKVLTDHGFVFKRIEQDISILDFIISERLGNKKGTVLFATNDHIITMKNGMIYDLVLYEDIDCGYSSENEISMILDPSINVLYYFYRPASEFA